MRQLIYMSKLYVCWHNLANLEEALPETDVLVVSLGGNDVLGGIFEPFRYLDEDETSYREYAWTATEALSEAPAQIERALEHVRVIIETARERRPNMDVVWVLYPNLLRGKPWHDSLSVGANLIGNRRFAHGKSVRPNEKFGRREFCPTNVGRNKVHCIKLTAS